MSEWKDCGHCDSPAEHALHLKLHEVECRLFESERRLDTLQSDLDSVTLRYNNLCNVLNEQTEEIKGLMGRLDAIRELVRVAPGGNRYVDRVWALLNEPVVETSSPKTWDELVARNKAATLDDEFGNMWLKCDRGDCGLHIVRPGKVQCEHEQCPTSHKSE